MTSSVSTSEATVDRLIGLHQKIFSGNALVFRAPGRVNLIGEHTDYNDGFVMPMAIGFYTWVTAAKREDRTIAAYSEHFNEKISFPLDQLSGPPRKHWSDFVRGVAATLQGAGHALTGANLVIHGEVPLGAGLSSSASFEVALAMALTTLSGTEVSRLELVKLCQAAEHKYVGTRCGIMDQFVAAFGASGHALMLDCRSLEYQMLPIPQNFRVIVCNSMVRHELASGEYNRRRTECEAGVKILQSAFPNIRALRDVTLKDLEEAKSMMPDTIYRRCRHVVTEDQRVLDAANALQTQDLDRFGQLMYQSHASLRDDYEVSCAELDLLVDIASSIRGVDGARMMGGGFGGCTVNLVQSDWVTAFHTDMRKLYAGKVGTVPDLYICEPAQGAEAWPV
jgi:galactokinase